MIFDWTINLGNVVQMVCLLGGGIWLFFSMKNDIRVLSLGLEHLQDSIKILNSAFAQLSQILTQVAVQDSRLGMMEKYIDELRHGQGFVKST